MSAEHLGLFQPKLLPRPVANELKLVDKETIIESKEFDLSSFFGTEEAREELESVVSPQSNLFVTLKNDANESITTITTKVTAESFAAGASFTSNVLSALGALAGSCGVVCSHSLSALGKAGSGLSGVSGLASGTSSGFSMDNHGDFHLDGNLSALSKATGISKNDLVSGRFSSADILSRFLSVFGEDISLIFGFGMVKMFADCFFSSFLPGTGEVGELSTAA